MKIKMLCGFLVLAASLSSAPASAADACTTVLCMFGLISGQNSSECTGAIADYFGIISWHHGHPDLGATAQSRLSFTQQCASAPGPFINMIDQTYGSVIR